MPPAVLSAEQIYAVARQAGFNHDQAIIMTAIALGESGGNPRAHNPRPPDNSYGLWQINMIGSLGPARRRQFGIPSNEALFDPLTNARAAFIVSGGGGNFRPWTVYTRGIYRNYLGAASAAAARVGDNFVQFLPGGPNAGAASSFSTTSTVTGVGGPAPGESPEDFARRTYGYLGWFLDHPEIGPIILNAAREGWDTSRLLGALVNTEWWKNTSEAARLWEAELVSDPATARERVRARVAEIEDLIGALGIEVDPNKVFEIAAQTLKFGIDVNSAQFRNTLASLIPDFSSTSLSRADTGSFAQTLDEIKKLAKVDYMVGIADADAWSMAQRIVAGDLTMEGVKQIFKQVARGRFPHLADMIDRGVTPGDFFAPYRNAIAQTLEMSVDQIDLLDPRWAPVLGVRDEKVGVRPMTLSETLTFARSQPEWAGTQEFRERSSSLVVQLAEAMGKAVF